MFESRLELFKVIMQEYRESFRRSSDVRRDQGFFFCGQMVDFLHRLLRRIVVRDCLPEEDDWDALLDFDFTNAQFLSVSQFMQKTEFRTKAMRAAKGRINVEREKNKKVGNDVVGRTVMGEMFKPHVDQRRAYIRYVCKELINHSTFKTTWSWVWRVLITLFRLPCQKIKLEGVICVSSIVSVFVDGWQKN